MFDLLEGALEESGIGEGQHDRVVDRGDGAVMLVRPGDEVPKTLLLTSVVPAMARLLAEFNATGWFGSEVRLRVAVHADEVHYDRRGPFGEGLDIACRLVDSSVLRRALRGAPGPLVLAVSDSFHRAVIRHNFAGIDPNAFKRDVLVRIGGRRVPGWIHCPVAAKEERPITA
ncbi:hypothetical protein [Amycolatopsis sp. WGS_07]|uniref:hypothetical protein n=1 Tax=Amycolatopsis sp. WGS_07 TaxID=3076764 RepID=UPI0038737C85